MLDPVTTITMQDMQLVSNMAETGNGGGLALLTSTADDRLPASTMRGLTFTSNTAPMGGGGAVYWNFQSLGAGLFSDAWHGNNSAKYGSDTASSSKALRVQNAAVYDVTDPEYSTPPQMIGGFVSPAINVAVVDAYGQVVSSLSGQSVEAQILGFGTSNGSIVGPSRLQQVTQGVALFGGLALLGNQQSRVELGFELSLPSGLLKTSEKVTVEFGQCPAGRYFQRSSQGCQPCSVGKYSDEAGLVDDCKACPEGSAESSTGQTSCTVCTAGRFSPTSGLRDCFACAVGQYSSDGATRCTLCPAGRQQEKDGQSGCNLCVAGYYQDSRGAAECNACEVGRYSVTAGATSCVDCLVGEYQEQKGQSSCKPCEKGFFQDTPGAGDCKQCPTGRYNTRSNQTSCLACPLAGVVCDSGTVKVKPGAFRRW